ncbi:acylphosphatase [Rhodohalobacter sp.]|uniref:acylphosphatase n=1 Tax=Rhodohalobacter sp. TaxID=1974210 RepID=UPI002ACD4CB6|nr:acylphosphatase [Rhodohalobacter sp.]MDZ7756256.1 acylphosphatase [Rhodohalobacter sp.]
MKKHIFINGRVQGVGFRHFTRTNAESLGVKGWVENLPDGRVEAVFEGDEESVQELIDRCKEGPPSAYVKNMEIEDEKEKGAFSEFRVRF